MYLINGNDDHSDPINYKNLFILYVHILITNKYRNLFHCPNT